MAHQHGHGPHHGHVHGHGHGHPPAAGAPLGLALFVTLAFVVGEAVAGWWADSLALMSDAGHNLADALSLGLTWWAIHAATRKADARRTFGYHRIGVLAALANAVALVLIAAGIFWEAWQRLAAPVPVASGTVMAVAAAALAVNLLVSWWLRRGTHDLAVRGAYLHMLADAAASAGVIAAGAVIRFTDWLPADALASVLIGVLILWSSWGVLREAVGVLLEAAPADLDMDVVGKAIAAVPGVLGLHDLHAWTLGTGVVACSCHILVAEQPASSAQAITRVVAAELGRFGISHPTIQLEVTACAADQGLYCVGEPHVSDAGDAEHSHAHGDGDSDHAGHDHG